MVPTPVVDGLLWGKREGQWGRFREQTDPQSFAAESDQFFDFCRKIWRMARVHREESAPAPRVLEADPHRHGHRSAHQLERDR